MKYEINSIKLQKNDNTHNLLYLELEFHFSDNEFIPTIRKIEYRGGKVRCENDGKEISFPQLIFPDEQSKSYKLLAIIEISNQELRNICVKKNFLLELDISFQIASPITFNITGNIPEHVSCDDETKILHNCKIKRKKSNIISIINFIFIFILLGILIYMSEKTEVYQDEALISNENIMLTIGIIIGFLGVPVKKLFTNAISSASIFIETINLPEIYFDKIVVLILRNSITLIIFILLIIGSIYFSIISRPVKLEEINHSLIYYDKNKKKKVNHSFVAKNKLKDIVVICKHESEKENPHFLGYINNNASIASLFEKEYEIQSISYVLKYNIWLDYGKKIEKEYPIKGLMLDKKIAISDIKIEKPLFKTFISGEGQFNDYIITFDNNRTFYARDRKIMDKNEFLNILAEYKEENLNKNTLSKLANSNFNSDILKKLKEAEGEFRPTILLEDYILKNKINVKNQVNTIRDFILYRAAFGRFVSKPHRVLTKTEFTSLVNSLSGTFSKEKVTKIHDGVFKYLTLLLLDIEKAYPAFSNDLIHLKIIKILAGPTRSTTSESAYPNHYQIYLEACIDRGLMNNDRLDYFVHRLSNFPSLLQGWINEENNEDKKEVYKQILNRYSVLDDN